MFKMIYQIFLRESYLKKFMTYWFILFKEIKIHKYNLKKGFIRVLLVGISSYLSKYIVGYVSLLQ